LVRRAWAWLIAHFCILANGVYLGVAWISGDRFLDSAMMLEKGAHPAFLLLYCFITIPIGYAGLRRTCVNVLQRPLSKTDRPTAHV
jgi:hypothetical protein